MFVRAAQTRDCGPIVERFKVVDLDEDDDQDAHLRTEIKEFHEGRTYRPLREQ